MPAQDQHRSLWQDRFNKPEVDSLLAALEATHRSLFERARDGLLTLEGCAERFGWEGVPLRWCLAFSADDAEPFAYLIPDPEEPKICLPLPATLLDTLKPREVTKIIREGILASSPVDGVFWPTWSLASKSGVDDLIALAARALAHEDA